MTRWCLVVEDEPLLGEMICDNLVAEGWRAELATDGEAALTRLERGGLDVVILDVMLPKKDGFDVLREMRGRGDETPVLVLSARAADEDRIRGLELNADDYLTKPFNLRELLLRVAGLLRRSPPLKPELDTVTFGGHRVDFRAHTIQLADGQTERLSDSEVRLLRLLAFRDGEAITRREIQDHVFGSGTVTNARTLDNLVLGLRKRIESDGRNPRHLHTVRNVGFRFTQDPES